jgi:hypothetical protein
MRRYYLAAACLFCFGPSLRAADRDPSLPPPAAGYGGNLQPDPSQKTVPAAGMGADMTPDPDQKRPIIVGVGGLNTAVEPQAEAPTKAPAAATPAQNDIPGIYRSLRRQAGDEGSQAGGSKAAPKKRKAAATLSDAKETLPSLIGSYVDTHGKNGAISLKGGGSSLLRFSALDHGTVKALARRRFTATAIFTDGAGRDVKVRVDADFSGNDWKVTRLSAVSVVKRRRK